jgi:hypothetical protein
MRGKSPRFGTYTLDPANGIDRYEVYFTDGTGVCHDFASGEGYTMDGDYTAGRSVRSAVNVLYHLLCKDHMYSQAGQPDYGGKEIIPNENFDTGGSITRTAITGEYRTQWDDFEEEEKRKEISRVRVLGDASNTVVEFYQDFAELTSANKGSSSITDIPQSRTAYSKSFRLQHSTGASLFAYLWKFVFKLTGSSTDTAHNGLDEYGDLSESVNFRGVLLKVSAVIGRRENRA